MQLATKSRPTRANTSDKLNDAPAKDAPTMTARVTDRPGAADANAWNNTSTKLSCPPLSPDVDSAGSGCRSSAMVPPAGDSVRFPDECSHTEHGYATVCRNSSVSAVLQERVRRDADGDAVSSASASAL